MNGRTRLPGILRSLYALVIGVLLMAFVAFGVQAFSPAPESPEYPTFTSSLTDEELREDEREYERRMDEYEEDISVYSRNVFIVATAASVVVLALCLYVIGGVPVIGPGLLLGAVFTLFYGLGWAFSGGDDRLRFVASGVGLAILIFLAYRKFSSRLSASGSGGESE